MSEEDRQRLPFSEGGKLSTRTVVAIAIVAGALLFSLGVVIGSERAKNGQSVILGEAEQPTGVDFSPVWKAWQVIDDKFVPAAVATTTRLATSTEEANQVRVWGMIQGLAESLQDPYTFFLPPVENEIFAEDIKGAFEGVGMEIAVRDQVLTVVAPLRGAPAEKAGIQSGDKILKIDEALTRGMDISAAVSRIRGEKGTQVRLLVIREGWSEAREIRVTRDIINVPTIITTKRDDGIFVIELRSFTANSPELFRGALREFVESGQHRLILDLRRNPGGYLEAAVDMASWFLPSGRVVVTEDYAGNADNIVHRSRGYDIFNENLRMVILVDNGSASASEILAGALKHWGVAKMVGDSTFGKGSVQELVEITKDTALKVTVARWVGPDGIPIPLEGIAPDVVVKLTEDDAKADKDPQLDRAVEILKEM